MPKGYWITFYRSITNPAALGEYGSQARRFKRAAADSCAADDRFETSSRG